MKLFRWPGIINQYKNFLPVSEKTPIVTLNEGDTPLIHSCNISEIVGCNVYIKFEGLNPTGSFKDRGMTMAVTKALEEGADSVICASTGNTSASMAAYSARCGLKSFLLVPDGNVALGKLAQARIHGATVITVKGNFDKALSLVIEISEKYPITLVNSVNPYRLEGQKSGAFEVCDQLETNPTILSIPVGNAGNISAYWKGFKEYKEHGEISNLPRMFGFQAEGAAPIVEGRKFENPETVATAIRIGNPASWDKALNALDESDGYINKVSDDEILSAYRMLAQKDGIFCEPASATSIAGIIKYKDKLNVKKDDNIVCVVTGNGLKDPDNAIKQSGNASAPIEANINAILEKIGL